MSLVRQIALGILCISFAVFVSFFGSLPIFRRTPIGFLNSLIWIYIPNGLGRVDAVVTGGRVGARLKRLGNYLMHEKHPIVLIFFLLLLLISEILFLTISLPFLSTTFPPSPNSHRSYLLYLHFLLIPLLTLPPYLYLFLSVTTPSTITPSSHTSAMQIYPYDHTIFHGPNGYYASKILTSPNDTTQRHSLTQAPTCRTCGFSKPARSKHCPLCQSCIQKHDHHCVWINNCVGRNNYIYFLLLMLSISVLLAYGAYLGFKILSTQLNLQQSASSFSSGEHGPPGDNGFGTWIRGTTDFISRAIMLAPLLAAPTLLAALSFPLAAGLTSHHVYLVWAGMTTNESGKWADLRVDIQDGVVWRARVEELRGDFPELRDGDGKENDDRSRVVEVGEYWPRKPSWVVIRMQDSDRRPRIRRADRRPDRVKMQDGRRDQKGDFATAEASNSNNDTSANGQAGEWQWEEDVRWTRVQSLSEIENIYDLGFRDNWTDVLWNR